MTIQLEAPTSRYTTTQTQTQRLAPLGSFAAAGDVPKAQIETLDQLWSDLVDKVNALPGGGIPKTFYGVAKDLNSRFQALYDGYNKWWSTLDTVVRAGNVTAPGFAAQQAAFNTAKEIYIEALAAIAAKPAPKQLPSEVVKVGVVPVLVALGAAVLLFTLPKRGGGPGLTSIDMFPNTRRRGRGRFGALKVGARVQPRWLTKAPSGKAFVHVATDRIGRVIEVGRGRKKRLRVEWESTGRSPAVTGWYDEEALVG